MSTRPRQRADSPLIPIRRALVSVSDKTGVAELGARLAAIGAEVLSTGGTARALADAGVAVTEVSDYTGFPEIMDGRVKTLQPKIHGGILARRDDPAHRRAMAEHGIEPIDLVVVNLYPFEATAAAGAAYDECVEQIDIGGPALFRAAAKNHAHVAVVTDPSEYDQLLAEMEAHEGATTLALRRRLAAAAYARTAAYDAAIARWFADLEGEVLPPRLILAASGRVLLRYGENPHQMAAFYAGAGARPGAATAEQIQGKALSYNNLSDADAAFELVAEFERPAVAIVKHANPCGVACAESLAEAWPRALASDRVSAFGGIVALNRALDAATAEQIAEIFTEVVIAPEVEAEARRVLAAKRNLRLLVAGAMPDPKAPGLVLRSLAGGWLMQSRDAGPGEAPSLEVVSRRPPGEAESADLAFAFTVCKHVKSNAIVFAKGGATVGIGAGQTSRVDAVRIAAWKAADAAREAGEEASRAEGAVLASDAFFPFADGVIAAAEAGATAIVQPGGSLRDEEVIAAADARGLAMVFTGVRHFRH